MPPSEPGTPEERISFLEATVRSLVGEIDQRFDDLQDELDRRFTASSDVTEEFKKDITRRFENVNEFRSALDDLGQGMATRRELKSSTDGLKDYHIRDIDDIRATLADIREDISSLTTQVAVGPPDIDELKDRSEQILGAEHKSRQIINRTTAWISIAVLLTSAIISLIINLLINK
jgi:chromosome segregation ATPase